MRKLIDKNEFKISILQLVGFILILLGIIGLIVCSFIKGEIIPSIVSVSFFITMLGFSFAFPSLLEGNEGLSTMRITVFMVTNVICMLLLKIGWAASIKTLGAIGLDQYWMGVIAFVFGAKATQSFFESKMVTVSGKDDEEPLKNDVPENILIEAIEKNAAEWKSKYNVLDISVGIKKIKGIENGVNCIVFRPLEKLDKNEDEYSPIPSVLSFTAQNGTTYLIETDVQKTGGLIASSFSKSKELCDATFPKKPGCSISRLLNDSTGTLGLKVFKSGKPYLLSCYHVLCSSELDNNILSFDPEKPADDKKVISPSLEDGGSSNDVIANVSEGYFNEFIDAAIALLDNDFYINPEICRVGKTPTRIQVIDINHVNAHYKVFMSGRSSEFQTGKITSSYSSVDIIYGIGGSKITKTLRGIISTSLPSRGGDSGAPVVDSDGNIIGIVVASSPQNTYVIPISRILSQFKLTLK